MSYVKNANFDFSIPMRAEDAAEMIVEHRYNKDYGFVYFDVEIIVIDDVHHVRFFTNDGPDDIIDVAKFILEIDNEVVPIGINTIAFPYTGNKLKPNEGGLMVVSLDTKEYADMDCAYVAEKIATGQFKFESAFRYVKRHMS